LAQIRRGQCSDDRVRIGSADCFAAALALGEMAVNLKTAKAHGLTMPQSILLRADKAIE
jgi:hypothetical protein